MALQRKITGLVELNGTPKFTVSVYGFKQAMGLQVAGRQGRGTGKWSRTRTFLPGGTLALRGKANSDAPPLPDTFKGQQGTVVLNFHRGAKQTVSVRVDQATIGLDDKDEQGAWDVGLTCTILDNPAFDGFTAAAAAATDPTKADVEVFAGLSKTYDPNNLQTAQSRQYDVWPLTDTDAAERQKLADLVATATANAFTGAKVKTASLLPGRTDDAGVIVVQLALTDTREDVLNPLNQTTVDPKGLQSSGTAADINGSPAVPAGFKNRGTTSQEIHDAAQLNRVQFGLTDTEEDELNPRNVIKTDPRGLQTSGTQAAMNATPATPSGLKSRGEAVEELNDSKSLHTLDVGLTDTEEDVTNPLNVLRVDPQGLASEGTQAAVNATPATPSGYKVRASSTQELNDSKSLTKVEYGLTDTAEDVTNPRNVLNADPEALESTGTQAAINATPATPGGYKVRSQRSTELNDNKTLTEIDVGLRTTKEDQEYLKSRAVTEPGQLDPERLVVKVTASATPDETGLNPDSTNLSFAGAESVRHTDGLWVHTIRFLPLTEQERREAADTRDTVDLSNIEDENTRAVIDANATAPAAPAVSGRVCDRHWTERRGKVRYLHVYHYAYRSTESQMEAERRELTNDQGFIRDAAVTADLYLAASPPANPSSPLTLAVGTKLIDYTDHETRNPLYRLRVYRWGWRDSEDDARIPAEGRLYDQASLVDELSVVQFDADTDPLTWTPIADYKLIDVRVQEVRPGKYMHVGRYGRRDREDDVEMPGTWKDLDPGAIASKARTTELYTTLSGAPADPAAPSAELVITGRRTEVLNPLKSVRATEWGVRTPTQAVEQEASRASYFVLREDEYTEGTVVTCDSSDTVQALALAYRATQLTDPTFESVSYEKLSATRARRVVGRVPEFIACDAIVEGGYQFRVSRFNGFSVQVFCSRTLQRGTSLWRVLFAPQWQYRPVIRFVLRRRQPFASGVIPGPVGTRNQSPFLGLAAGTVSFLGGRERFRLNVGGCREFEYHFRCEPAGIYLDEGVVDGWHTTDADLSGVSLGTSGGWVNAGVLGLNLCTVPPSADYSVFTA